MRHSPFNRAIVLLSCFVLLLACRSKPKSVLAPPGSPVPQAVIQDYVSTGDSHLLESHLYGWRQAALYYQKAYDLARREEIREKLLLAQFLILTRQVDEDIPFQDIDATIELICTNPFSRRLRQLCYVAKQYRDGFGQEYWEAHATQKKEVDSSAFDPENSALDAYLYGLALRLYGSEPDKNSFNPFEAFKDSPLFLYLNFGRETVRRVLELEKNFSEFAELFAFTGEEYFQNSKFNAARRYFNKALQLVPDYTRAINGLANIHFFALEDYPGALEQYEKTLQWDPANTAALFGKGAALHQIDKYVESTEVLDRMLGSDISRKGRASKLSVRYYRGEANYYKAYNFYQTGNLVKARELINLAKQLLPDSEEINYLSGVIYFDVRHLEAARDDFIRVIQRGSTICNAHHYLGLIHLEWKDRQVYDHFLRTCSCIEGTKRNIEQRIRTIPTLDLDPSEKEMLRTRLERRLAGYIHSSAEQIKSMIQMIESTENEQEQNYVNLMRQMLSRLTSSETTR